jgi:hypothetical protein
MKYRHLILGLLVMSVTVSGGAIADSIYKWIDVDGNIHYEDRPSDDANVERIQLTYNRTNNTVVQERVQARLDAQTSRRQEKTAAAEKAQAREDDRRKAAGRQKKCDTYRSRTDTILYSRRIYREDENGERVYLDDAEREASRKRNEELIQEYCNS